MKLDNHTLYYRNSCPYCRKVLGFMTEYDITCDMADVTQPGIREQLSEIGGKAQVPCLVIEGKPLYESGDIIAYMKEKVS